MSSKTQKAIATAKKRATKKQNALVTTAVISAAAGGYLYAKNPDLRTLGASGMDTDLVIGGLGVVLSLMGKGGARGNVIGGIGLGRLCVAVDRLAAEKA